MKKTKPKLSVDFATHAAAKYACEKWHYSKCIPKSKLVKLGVWESDVFIGAVIFGVGATSNLVSKYGLAMVEGCELVRVALTTHESTVSRIVTVAIKFLKKTNPGLKLIVSFADPEQGHVGGIYQAMGWIYSGLTAPDRMYMIRGRKTHPRTVSLMVKAGKLTRSEAEKHRIPNDGKHRYLYALNRDLNAKLELIRKPYPKRASSKANVAPANHAGEGGATPTDALQLNEAPLDPVA